MTGYGWDLSDQAAGSTLDRPGRGDFDGWVDDPADQFDPADERTPSYPPTDTGRDVLGDLLRAVADTGRWRTGEPRARGGSPAPLPVLTDHA